MAAQHHRRRAAVCAILLALGLGATACTPAPQSPAVDRWIEPLGLSEFGPATVLPGTTLEAVGSGFLQPIYGEMFVQIVGTFNGEDINIGLPATLGAEPSVLQVAANPQLYQALGSDQGELEGWVRVVARRGLDGEVYFSEGLPLRLVLQRSITPRFDELGLSKSVRINDPIEVKGTGFLLGGKEGQTVARLRGCFTLQGGSGCTGRPPVEIPVTPASRFDRDRGHFPFAPSIAGIQPGSFRGTIELVNLLPSGERLLTATRSPSVEILRPIVRAIEPSSASLGQWLDIRGGGFVATDLTAGSSSVTTLELRGDFESERTASSRPVNLRLVPHFESGPHLRYVVSEADGFGMNINLRVETGTLSGEITPIIQYQDQQVRGDPTPIALRLDSVRQVVVLSFQPSYAESLRHFGLRGLDRLLREQIVRTARNAYAGINIDFRDREPEDFAIYSVVDLAGPDPNRSGLFGYDNTPGKDVNNRRLHDRIGGVNARTLEDGSPGYGGVFVDSLFGFSTHPGGIADKIEGAATPIFDQLFDPTRPDRKGRPVQAEDLLGNGVPLLPDGRHCPAPRGSRALQLACAVWGLGNLIGGTLAHEIGHSLGLADPFGDPDSFHNPGNALNRLMDSGGDRSFEERVVILGEGPSVFCDEEYDYLRRLMPGGDEPAVERPDCYTSRPSGGPDPDEDAGEKDPMDGGIIRERG